jgi:hypothetical protein
MRLALRSRIRHPFYPKLSATPAVHARGKRTALAGTFEELSRAARRGVRVERAVFVLTRAGEPFVTDSERDRLWESFGAPVFALLLDGDGRVMACECEMQRGLHIASRTAPVGVLETAPCECGRLGYRIFVDQGHSVPGIAPGH